MLPVDMFVNIKKIDKVGSPTLIIHGTMDGVVPYQHGQDLFAKAGKPYKFVSLEGAGHNDIEVDYRDELFAAWADFLVCPLQYSSLLWHSYIPFFPNRTILNNRRMKAATRRRESKNQTRKKRKRIAAVRKRRRIEVVIVDNLISWARTPFCVAFLFFSENHFAKRRLFAKKERMEVGDEDVGDQEFPPLVRLTRNVADKFVCFLSRFVSILLML